MCELSICYIKYIKQFNIINSVCVVILSNRIYNEQLDFP